MQSWEKNAGSCDEIWKDGEVIVRAGLVMVRWDAPKGELLHIMEGSEVDRLYVGLAVKTCRIRMRRSVRGASVRFI